MPPIVKLGLEVWPSPLWACLIGYVMSSLVVLTVQRVRKGSFLVQAPRAGLFWFAMTGISNGLSALTLFAAVRNGPITLVAPLAAIYPLVTVVLSAMRAQAHRDHRADRRRHRADRARRGAGADRLIRCADRQDTIARRAAVQRPLCLPQ